MSSLVHNVVSDVIASHQRLQQQQQQQLSSSPATCTPPLLSNENLDSNNNAGGSFSVNDSKQKSTTDIGKSSNKAGSSGEKYSLRPRSYQRRSESEDSDHMGTSTSRGGTRRGAGGSSTNRPKQKPPPLSKYRRKTANARERDRMREINAAFETLRRAVPHIPPTTHLSQSDNSGSEKLTKITTLRLAMKYISALSHALQQPETLIQLPEVQPTTMPPASSISSSSSSSGSLQLMSDGESLTFSEHCLTPPDLRQQSLTPPDFSRQCLTSANLTRLSSPDRSRQRGTPPLDNKRHNLTSADFTRHCLSSSRHVPSSSQKTLLPPSQNMLSSDLSISNHCMTSTTSSELCQNHPTTNLSRHCLLPPSLDQQCHQTVSNSNPVSQLCLSTPVLSRTCLPPPDLSQHCLTPADFEEHATEEHSSLLVFDDDSLDSPDLDHLLIS